MLPAEVVLRYRDFTRPIAQYPCDKTSFIWFAILAAPFVFIQRMTVLEKVVSMKHAAPYPIASIFHHKRHISGNKYRTDQIARCFVCARRHTYQGHLLNVKSAAAICMKSMVIDLVCMASIDLIIDR